MKTQPTPPIVQLVASLNREEEACLRFLEALSTDHRLLCAKTYRVALPSAGLPQIPCLDHEAALQGHPAPHVAVYVADPEDELHEVAFVPAEKKITVDAASTFAETSRVARERFAERLRQRFPDHVVEILRPSYVRGDERVASVVRSQLRLREVLSGEDVGTVKWKLERLRAIADYMEKESRAYSWGVRTITPPLLAGASVTSYLVLGLIGGWLSLSDEWVEFLRYAVLTLIGGWFLWVGMKAVHLTEMGSRVWKRSTEYKLILDARQRAEAPQRQAG